MLSYRAFDERIFGDATARASSAAALDRGTARPGDAVIIQARKQGGWRGSAGQQFTFVSPSFIPSLLQYYL
eukprot:6371829-Pyramimonas_sp.AAC.1